MLSASLHHLTVFL